MVVYYSVGPCKQSIRSMKFTSQMHSFWLNFFLHFNFEPSLPEKGPMNVINSTLTVIVTASIFIYLFSFVFLLRARHNSQFTKHTQFYCYLCENSNESKYPTDFNNGRKNYYNLSEFVLCKQNKRMYKRI